MIRSGEVIMIFSLGFSGLNVNLVKSLQSQYFLDNQKLDYKNLGYE